MSYDIVPSEAELAESLSGHARLVSVIIPNFNGRELLRVALELLRQQTFRDFAVTVVDNGSSDGSAEHLAAEWPEVSVIALPTNSGFAGAVNAGIGATRSTYVALVNNDVELAPDWLENLIALIEPDHSIASVTGKLLDYYDRQRLQEAGTLFAWTGNSRMRGADELDIGQYDTVADVFSVCAGAAVYRRDVIEQIGDFDESYFAYVEDLDWGLRARLAGYRAVYTPNARAYHMGQVTSGALQLSLNYLTVRNTLALILADYPLPSLVRYSPYIMSRQLLHLGRAIRQRQGRMYIKAWLDCARMIGEIRRKRAKVAQLAAGAPPLDLPARHPRRPGHC